VDKKKRMPGDQPIGWPKAEEASRAVREYLETLDAAQNRGENSEDDDKFDAGSSRRKPPKEVSLTDPQAVGCEDEHRSIFRLRRQLSHRQQSRDHRRCRGHARQPDC
jgi:hypothetical protein